eukprot:3431147-Rhodomonas_salina.3
MGLVNKEPRAHAGSCGSVPLLDSSLLLSFCAQPRAFLDNETCDALFVCVCVLDCGSLSE